MKTAIVTGANGFIGSYVIKELVHQQVKVYAVGRPNHRENVPQLDLVEYVGFDMSKIEDLTERLKGKTADVFYHFAWDRCYGSARSDYELQLNNAKYTVDAVIVAKKLGCKKFVCSGSTAEFDCNAYIPTLDSTPNPVSNYGTAKIAAHYMSKTLACQQGIDYNWVYLGNSFGVGCRAPTFINFASEIMLTGKAPNFTFGEQYYDFVYVSDIAHALYLVGEKGKNNRDYYIGSTKPMKLKSYLEIIRDHIDPNIKLNLGAIPYHGVEHTASVFDCSRLVHDTGYVPSVSFEEGIQVTLEWLKSTILK